MLYLVVKTISYFVKSNSHYGQLIIYVVMKDKSSNE